MARPMITITVNDKEVLAKFKLGKTTTADMLSIEAPIAAEIINKARRLVPKKTHATDESISQHIKHATPTFVMDHVGSETDYSKYIEFGVPSKPNYPIQPFMRPASLGNIAAIKKAATAAFKAFVRRRYGRT